jgi:hypothetical protein
MLPIIATTSSSSSQEFTMNSRHPASVAIPRTDSAMLRHGALRTARFLHTKVATPAAMFLLDSVEGIAMFAQEFADSAREVNKAMERARAERYTISAHRR